MAQRFLDFGQRLPDWHVLGIFHVAFLAFFKPNGGAQSLRRRFEISLVEQPFILTADFEKRLSRWFRQRQILKSFPGEVGDAGQRHLCLALFATAPQGAP